VLVLAATGWLCCTVASAEDTARPEDRSVPDTQKEIDAERPDDGSALDLQEEMETVRKERSAGRKLKDLIRVRLKLESRFVPETDFDGFDATLYRPSARLKVTVPVSKRAALRLVASAETSVYDFDDVDPDPFGIGAMGGEPFDDLHNLGFRLQGGYRFDDLRLFSEREHWSILGEASIRAAWEDGSPIDRGLRQGGGLAVGYKLGDFLEIAVGAGVSTRLVKSGVSVSPRLEVDWKISDTWRILSYGQGAQVEYKVNNELVLFARGRIESRRYRLDRRPGAVGRGSIRDQQIPAGLGVRWQIGRHLRLTGVAGAIAHHQFKIRDRNGDSIGSTVTGDPAPYFELRFDLRP
jgi:hypothetical protein